MHLLLAIILSSCQLLKTKVPPPSPAVGQNYMVTSQGVFSSQIGAEVLAQGGSVVDSAVAVSFALAVERPQSTGIGGGGFMLLHLAKDNQTMAIDFRETAPSQSARSIGLPSLVAGLEAIHQKYGVLPWKQLLQPAVALAEKGFPIYPHLVRAIVKKEALLKKYLPRNNPFFHSHGGPLQEGEILRQKDLAQTLKIIQGEGSKGFYSGKIGQKIIATYQKLGGQLSKQDFQSYRVRFREPVWGEFKNLKIASMPPPSSGGINLVQIFNILSGYPMAQYRPLSAQAIHLTVMAMKQSFATRLKFVADGDFVDIPLGELTSINYGNKLRDKIDPYYASTTESSQTAHFTIMDSQGNTVSSTQTINGHFGSGVIVAGTGIVLNNELDDFSSKEGSVNSLEKGKRPLSSMSPTIVFDASKTPLLALGSPGELGLLVV